MNADKPTSRQLQFRSFEAFKKAHMELRRRFSGADTQTSLLDEIILFIGHGRECGKLLDDVDERWSCQCLLDYWLTTLYDLGEDGTDATLEEFDPNTTPELPDDDCPYMGLNAYREKDADLFVGRRHMVKNLVGNLADRRLLMITGPSGSGKSSLVMAGLIPALKSGALPGSENWHYCEPITPGADPVANLPGIVDGEAMPRVLVIDQLEEAFSLCDNPGMREAFSQRVLALADAGDRIVFTMQSASEPSLAELPALQQQLRASRIAITPLGAADLRRAIEEPAERVGLKFEKGVVAKLVEDLVAEPANLPLLQFTLMTLWENRTRNRITLDTYETLGGGRLALQRRADTLFNDLNAEEQISAQGIFMKLAVPGAGVEVTRQRIPIEAIHSANKAPERVEHVLACLINAHLVRKIEGDAGASAQFEVVPEALVRSWPTLVGWLDDARHTPKGDPQIPPNASRWHSPGRGAASLSGTAQRGSTEGAIHARNLNQKKGEAMQAPQKLGGAEISKATGAKIVNGVWGTAILTLGFFALSDLDSESKTGLIKPDEGHQRSTVSTAIENGLNNNPTAAKPFYFGGSEVIIKNQENLGRLVRDDTPADGGEQTPPPRPADDDPPEITSTEALDVRRGVAPTPCCSNSSFQIVLAPYPIGSESISPPE